MILECVNMEDRNQRLNRIYNSILRLREQLHIVRYDVEVLISDDEFDIYLINRLTELTSQLSNLAETLSVVSQERRERAAARSNH